MSRAITLYQAYCGDYCNTEIMQLNFTLKCSMFDARQNFAGGGPVTMSYRSRSLDRHGSGGDRSYAEQQGGRGVISLRLGRSGRTSTSALDSRTNDDDITDSAWRRSVQNLNSSSTNRDGQFAPLRFVSSAVGLLQPRGWIVRVISNFGKDKKRSIRMIFLTQPKLSCFLLS